MKTEILRIGNSRGIRIPKPIIEQCGFGESVDLVVEEDRLVIRSKRLPRQGWEEAFRAAGSSAGDDLLLGDAGLNDFDRKEWKW